MESSRASSTRASDPHATCSSPADSGDMKQQALNNVKDAIKQQQCKVGGGGGSGDDDDDNNNNKTMVMRMRKRMRMTKE